MNFSNKQYDTIKWIAQIALPALGTLYAALSGIWGLPYSQEIVATIIALDAFLGVALSLSSAAYHANTIEEDVEKYRATVQEIAEIKYQADLDKNQDLLGK